MVLWSRQPPMEYWFWSACAQLFNSILLSLGFERLTEPGIKDLWKTSTPRTLGRKQSSIIVFSFPIVWLFVLLLFLQPWPASYVKVSELLLRRRCCWCYWVKMASFFTPGHYAAGQRRNSATPAAAAVAALCSPSIISVLGRLDRVTIAGKGGSQGCGCYLSSGGKFCECILCCTSRFVQDISKPLWD